MKVGVIPKGYKTTCNICTVTDTQCTVVYIYNNTLFLRSNEYHYYFYTCASQLFPDLIGRDASSPLATIPPHIFPSFWLFDPNG